MPSRRQVVASLGAGCSSLLAGCPATQGSSEQPSTDSPATTASDSGTSTPEAVRTASGLAWRKEIQVEATKPDDSSIWTEVLRVRYEPDIDRLSGRYDPAYVDGVSEEATVDVSQETHDSLSNEFSAFRYSVALGPINERGDHLHATAYREGFNQLTLAAQATVEEFWVQVTENLRRGYVRPTTTQSREQDISTVDISTFSLGSVVEGY